ncbi:MAG: hypothetical protein GY768_19515 [Planctomycetaceae bacterium]|nr:hypothetical protein [Planctomycetaceae bacterium]
MKTDQKNWGIAAFFVRTGTEAPSAIHVGGRDRWALECLIAAGETGCTPIETPGPRWSGYVFNLRQLGVDIETINEPHEGPFPGTHARYVLRSSVTRAEAGEAAA